MPSALVRPATVIPSLDNPGHSVDVPVVGLSYRDVFAIMARGATDVDTLRRHIEERLDADGRARFRINLQRLQPMLDGHRVGHAAQRQGVAGDPRHPVRIPQRTHGHDAGVEGQRAAARGEQPALRRLQRGDAVAQETVPGLSDDGGAVQPQALQHLHAGQDLVDIGLSLIHI